MQLFVTYKGFFRVVPMTKKIEVPMALKMFAKDIGAPDAIIYDAAHEQISKEIFLFLLQDRNFYLRPRKRNALG